ncbi:DUF2244 domain-containing protein [Aestuariirhabdus sp. Z084]|uniref:DUF2244 domain-containing protein n=1 Tax=Aestuariirhabdus haliotis TaxID=2918751 RepID=UPI0020C0F2AD|nr:DUF2244 domain-containing protein [Aestuariirhabdus haliotis]MCL6417084.1 DUF2244 domain-containing protein [Aestuariirhabdus haliotis]
MVATQVTPTNEVQILLRANQSASWRINLCVLAGISVAGLFIAFGFMMLGAPWVLLFVGLEIVALAVCFFLASRATTRQQLIRIGKSQLVVEKGHLYAEEALDLPRQWTRVCVEQASHPLGSDRLYLRAMDKMTPVGEFLNQPEIALLRDRLRQQGLPIDIQSRV